VGVVSVTNTNELSFTLTASSGGSAWALCLAFGAAGAEGYKLYTAADGFGLKGAQVLTRAFERNAGACVAGVANTLTLTGDSVSALDVFRVVLSTASTAAHCTDSSFYVAGGFTAGTNAALAVAVGGGGVQKSLTFPAHSAAGTPHKLCYQFASEGFQLYAGLSATVMAVTGVTSSVGSASVAVAGYAAKAFIFAGTGLADGDRLKWVASSANTDADCSGTTTGVTGSGVTGGVATVAVAGNELTFAYADRGTSLKLCYSFNNEPYRLYGSIAVAVYAIESVAAALPAGSSGSLAVKGLSKKLSLTGPTTAAGDLLKWVLPSVTTDAGCTAAAEQATGTALVVDGSGSAVTFTPVATAGDAWRFVFSVWQRAVQAVL